MLRRGLLLAVVVAAAVTPVTSTAHLHQGHLILGAGQITSPQPGTLTVTAGEREGLGRIGIVTINGATIVADCVEVFDEAVTEHFVRLGWNDVGGSYELWIYGTSGVAGFELFKVTGGSYCSEDTSLGGVLGGRGAFAVLV